MTDPSPTNAFEDAEIAREEGCEREVLTPRELAYKAVWDLNPFFKDAWANGNIWRAVEAALDAALSAELPPERVADPEEKGMTDLVFRVADWAIEPVIAEIADATGYHLKPRQSPASTTAADAWDACLDAIEEYELNTEQARQGNPYRVAAPEGDGGNE